MQTSRDLAHLAARLAAGIDHESIDAFSISHDNGQSDWHVTLHLTDGTTKVYGVYEVKEEDTPAGESLPW